MACQRLRWKGSGLQSPFELKALIAILMTSFDWKFPKICYSETPIDWSTHCQSPRGIQPDITMCDIQGTHGHVE